MTTRQEGGQVVSAALDLDHPSGVLSQVQQERGREAEREGKSLMMKMMEEELT